MRREIITTLRVINVFFWRFARYLDLNCPDVEGILMILLIFSSACNGLSTLVAGWYSYLHWCTRQKRPQYRQVRTNAVYTNNPLNSRPIYKPSSTERWRPQTVRSKCFRFFLSWFRQTSSVNSWIGRPPLCTYKKNYTDDRALKCAHVIDTRKTPTTNNVDEIVSIEIKDHKLITQKHTHTSCPIILHRLVCLLR